MPGPVIAANRGRPGAGSGLVMHISDAVSITDGRPPGLHSERRTTCSPTRLRAGRRPIDLVLTTSLEPWPDGMRSPAEWRSVESCARRTAWQDVTGVNLHDPEVGGIVVIAQLITDLRRASGWQPAEAVLELIAAANRCRW